MQHTSASGTFNQGSAEWKSSGKARVLRSTSALALGRVIENAMLPGLFLAGSLLVPSNHLEALDIQTELAVPIQSLKTVIAPQAGSPVVVVSFEPSAHSARNSAMRAEHTFEDAAVAWQRHFPLARGVFSESLDDRVHERSPDYGNLKDGEFLSEWLEFGIEHLAIRNDFISSLSNSVERMTAESVLHSTQLSASLAHAFESLNLREQLPSGGRPAPQLPYDLPVALEQTYGDRRLWEFLTLGQAAYPTDVSTYLHQALAVSERLGRGSEVSQIDAIVGSAQDFSSADARSNNASSGLSTGLVVDESASLSGEHQFTSGLGGYRANPTSFEERGDPPIPLNTFDPKEWQSRLVPSIQIAAPSASNVDLGAEVVPPAPVTNPSSIIVPAGALVHDKGEAYVSLGYLIDLMSERFDESELSRLRASSANASYVPISVLRDNDILVQIEGFEQGLTGEAKLAQSNAAGPNLPAGAAGEQSGTASSLTKMIDMSASAGFDSNPFLAAGSNVEAASVRLLIAPTIQRAGARGSVRASARAEHIEYLRQYGSLQNFGADLAGVHRLTERLQLDAAALFSSNVLGTNLTNPLIGEDIVNPVNPGLPGGGDVTLLGQRQRREQFGADVGLTLTPSVRDELRWSASFRADRFATGGLTDSDFYSQQLRYSRQISSAISLGAVVDSSIINFTDAVFGDTRTVSPQALVVAKLGDRFEASAALGLALSKVDLATGSQTNTATAGSLSLCYRSQLSSLCANGARQVLPSAIGGARVQTTGGLSYSLRLSERESLQFGGSYSTASEPLAALGGNFESINAFGRYERTLNERMRLQASVGYLDTSGGAAVNASSFQALVGISVRFGRDK